jgi:hypothetical protein
VYELKTKENDNSVLEFIEQIEHPRKKEDAYRLLDLFTETTGYPAKMWGPSIIGFGSYHYKYDSGHEGDAPLVGFSPRKRRSAFTWRRTTTNGNLCCKSWANIRREKAVYTLTKWRILTPRC